ncbi:ParM/StbA family protein [Shewanella sp. KX20019]|uniref:ParM/StbA family protein n=1 Tax=Shewanella sp. KX20019 TaxID=2803864 RepID=UPI0019297BCE|nr:ParM/StbA family protein [Shewanella sp. KX20019]QQX80873.1 ParM/StbA family protein [Shewanella sp. KX20019]
MIGADIGCAFVKLAFYDSEKNIQNFCIPSIISQGRGIVNMGGDSGITYQCDGVDFAISKNSTSIAIDTRNENYPFSPENTVLLQHALLEAGITGDVKIATGITYGQFFNIDGINQAKIEQKKKSAATKVLNSTDAISVNVIAEKVLPEGLAGAWGCSHDDHGVKTREYNFGFICVDIGGRTTDIVVGTPDFEVNTDLSETVKLGYLDIFKELNEQMKRHHSMGDFSPFHLNKFYNDRFFEIGGSKIDIGHLCDIAKKTISDRLIQIVSGKVDRSNQVDEVIFIGGGAEDLRNELGGFERSFIPEAPAFANARAYCIMGNL